MKPIHEIISSLSFTPDILSDLISEIPNAVQKTQRLKNKWTIHEHACHIVCSEKFVFHDRLLAFRNETEPTMKPFSGESLKKDYLINMGLDEALKEFRKLRTENLNYLKELEPAAWKKSAVHPEYINYNLHIMLRHFLMHDYFHMYRIEELWLTKNL